MPTAVFVNNFKVYVSSTAVIGAPVHVHVHPLVQRIETGMDHIVSRWIKGNFPDIKHPLWRAFVIHGYLHDPSSEKVSSAYNAALLALSKTNEPVSLVLVLGGEVGPEELDVMRGVLAQGGAATVWIWKRFKDADSLALAAEYNGSMHLKYLDNYSNMVSVRHNPRDSSLVKDTSSVVRALPSPVKAESLENHASCATEKSANMPIIGPEIADKRYRSGPSLPILILMVMPLAFLYYFRMLSTN